LALIRRLVDERPSYGYRRIRRLINRQRKGDDKPPVNGKRVLLPQAGGHRLLEG
jgi:putative transposase